MGATRPTRLSALDGVLHDHGDALYDFALAVTDSPCTAIAVVREALRRAVGEHAPRPTRAALLGSVLDTAVRRTPEGAVLPDDLLDLGSGSGDELQRVCREAARALPVQARGVLDLMLRQGLEGEELGEALGVPAGQVSAATKATLETSEHLIGAVVLARVARADCPGLGALVSEWTPASGAQQLAETVAAHQSVCTGCDDRRRALAPVTSLLATLPPTPAPAELWGSPALPDGPVPRPRARFRHRLRPLLAAGAVTGAAVLVALGLILTRGGEQFPGGASAGGHLEAPGEGVDVAPGGNSAVLGVANAGEETLEFSALPGAPWLRVEPGVGTVPPGDRLDLVVLIDRERTPEGAVGEVRMRSSGGTAVVPVRAGIERPPALSGLIATPEATVREGCPGAGAVRARVSVVEESGIDRVELHHQPRRERRQVSAMTRDGASWTGAFGPFDRAGTVEWWVTAVDIRGNAVTSAPAVMHVSDC